MKAARIIKTKEPLEIKDVNIPKPKSDQVLVKVESAGVCHSDLHLWEGGYAGPQGVFMKEHLTLSRALAMVGGASKVAKTSDIRIYRQRPDTGEQETIHVDLSAIKKGQKPDIELQAYDIVDVPEAGLFSGGRLGQTLLSAVTGSLGSAISATGAGLPTRVLY